FTFIENDFAFIQQQILDNINLKATAHIIQLICYENDMNIIQALFNILTYLIEQNPNNITNDNTNDQQQ
ncbi:unnamed protein product, partial [Rotaria sp. Silwood2]